MKKGIKLLLAVLLLLPIFVFADSVAPDYISYDVEVLKDEGIDYYDYKGASEGVATGHLDKGTRLTIEFTVTYNGENYLYTTYDKKAIYVKATDVVAIGEIDIDAHSVIDTKEENKVKITDEVIVRKGPAESFPEAGRIKNAETTYRYAISPPTYIYVDYNGIKGWIDANSEGITYGFSDIILFEETSGKCGTIPKSTVLEDIWSMGFYDDEVELKYNKCTFTTNLSKMKYAKLLDVKKVYRINYKRSFYSDDDKDIILNKGDEITVLSSEYNGYYYVDAGEDKGWLEIDLEKESTYVKDLKEEVKQKKNHEEDEKDTNVVVLTCVVGGVAFALGAIVTLILINRKKQVKKEKEGK